LMEAAEKEVVSKSQGAVLTYLLLDETLSDEDVHANITEMLMAGVDTTSNTLVWTLYELSRNPDLLLKLEKEIESTMGDATPSTKAIHKMPFLKNCIKESLRKYPGKFHD
jgi:cytochrome P450